MTLVFIEFRVIRPYADYYKQSKAVWGANILLDMPTLLPTIKGVRFIAFPKPFILVAALE
jgi:hypothetical protein